MNEEQINREELLSAKEERRQEIERSFNPDHMQVIRKELFANLRDPAVTLRRDSITFNTACINGLEDVVYIKLMLDENQKYLSITACDENDKYALRWCVAKPDKRKSRKMRCPDFTLSLFEKMGWSDKCRYKVLGYKIEYNNETYYVFDLNVRQIFNEKPRKGEEPVDENGVAVQVDTRTGYYPADIANTFGVPMERYKKETEIKDMDGYVTIAALTGVEDTVKPDAVNDSNTDAQDKQDTRDKQDNQEAPDNQDNPNARENSNAQDNNYGQQTFQW